MSYDAVVFFIGINTFFRRVLIYIHKILHFNNQAILKTNFIFVFLGSNMYILIFFTLDFIYF